MMEVVSNLVTHEKIDVIQAESLFMGHFCVEMPCWKVLDLHNIESLLMRRYASEQRNLLKRAYAEITRMKLEKYEKAICGRFHHTLTCSSQEREIVANWHGNTHTALIPNGVDLQTYHLSEEASEEEDRVVFVGKMDYHANIDAVVWFARDILPLIRAHRPGVKFQIVGGFPTKEVQSLGRLPGIEVTGFVEDVRPYLSRATCVVVPLKIGAGTRLKIVEALALGKALVSTSLGAEGIEVKSGQEALLADDPQIFADQVLRVLRNLTLRRDLGRAGRSLVERHYSWDVIGSELQKVYSSF
jgi:sugar transferase (PEP-CTERM/EpsH1 system associated)